MKEEVKQEEKNEEYLDNENLSKEPFICFNFFNSFILFVVLLNYFMPLITK